MPLYSKNREISDKELDQVLGGTSAFGGSMLKYQIETDLDILSRKDPEAYKVLSAERDQLLKEGGRRIFSNANDVRVQSLVMKLRQATR